MSYTGTWRPHKVDMDGMLKYYKALEAPAAVIEAVSSGLVDKIYSKTEDKGDKLVTTLYNLPNGDRTMTVKIGEEYEDTNPLGKAKVMVVRDGNKLTSTETYENGKISTTTREVNGDEMTITVTTGDVTAVNIWKRD